MAEELMLDSELKEIKMIITQTHKETILLQVIQKLWDEAERQSKLPVEKRTAFYAEKVLEIINTEPMKENTSILTVMFFISDLLAWWCIRFWMTWDNLNLEPIFKNFLGDNDRSECISKIINYLESEWFPGANHEQIINNTLAITDFIKNKCFKLYALLTIASYMIKRGDKEQGIAILEKAFGYAESIEDTDTKIYMFKIIAPVIIESGEDEQSSELLKRILQNIFNSNDNNAKVYILRRLSIAKATQKDFKRAFEIAEDITDDDYKISAWMYIATQIAVNGDKPKAMEILQTALQEAQKLKSIDECHYGILTYEIINAMADKCADTQSALKEAESVDNPTLYIKIMTLIANILFQNGERLQAEEVVQKILNTVAVVEDLHEKYYAIFNLSEILWENDDKKRADDLIQKGLEIIAKCNSVLKHLLLIKYAKCLIKRGNIAKAKEFLETMLNSITKLVTLEQLTNMKDVWYVYIKIGDKKKV